MNLFRINKINFHLDLFEKRSVPNIYQDIKNIPGNFYSNGAEFKNSITIVNMIAPFFKVSQENIAPSCGVYSKSYRLGFAMDLKGSKSSGEFLRDQLGKKKFKNLRQERQQFERNFNITFSVYYGEINLEIYGLLLDKLESFITLRFKPNKSRHEALKKWDFYKESLREQILAGNASIFVLRDNDNPVAIAVNYHYGKIMYAAIISFDTQYSKYSLGKQMFYRQLEWCFENNYHLIDLGWGYFEYKIKFANAVYRYRTHVVYPKKNQIKRLLARFVSSMLLLKYYLVTLKYRRLENPEKTFIGRWMELD